MKKGKTISFSTGRLQRQGGPPLRGATEGRCRALQSGARALRERGPGILRSIRTSTGAGIFLDLKLHDIPQP